MKLNYKITLKDKKVIEGTAEQKEIEKKLEGYDWQSHVEWSLNSKVVQ